MTFKSIASWVLLSRPHIAGSVKGDKFTFLLFQKFPTQASKPHERMLFIQQTHALLSIENKQYIFLVHSEQSVRKIFSK